MTDKVEYVQISLRLNLLQAHIDGDECASATHASTVCMCEGGVCVCVSGWMEDVKCKGV